MASAAPFEQPADARSVYERQREEACADLRGFYEGSLNALFCIVSDEPATQPVRSALVATAQRGGFSSQEMIWVSIAGVPGKNAAQDSAENAVEGSETAAPNASAQDPLPAADLLRLIETIDPLCLVVLDQRTAELLSRAYNRPIRLEACGSILGRPCCAFIQFAKMLQDEDLKQRAWALFKEMLALVNDL